MSRREMSLTYGSERACVFETKPHLSDGCVFLLAGCVMGHKKATQHGRSACPKGRVLPFMAEGRASVSQGLNARIYDWRQDVCAEIALLNFLCGGGANLSQKPT